jgi:putative (di)nucleoside polyphosphate hydrolase
LTHSLDERTDERTWGTDLAHDLNLDLPYRPCVGIMLINRDGLVWVGRRLPKWIGRRSGHIWQMPQGGIGAGEGELAAALRELEEETAVRSVEIIAEAPGWLSYDLPAELLGVALKGRYRGQRQKWFAMRFTGSDVDINLATEHPEFDAWQWVAPDRLPELIVPFKRQLYIDILAEFREHCIACRDEERSSG